MTSTTGATLVRRQRAVALPFAIALGLTSATSPAVGTVRPEFEWTTTAVTGEPLHARVFDPIAPVDRTNSGVLKSDDVWGTSTSMSPAQRISELRALSGLTTDQVGRLFGVSRRSVHNWVNGNAMAPRHEERAAELLVIVKGLAGSTPEERRATLLDSSKGSSLFHQLAVKRERVPPLQVPGVSVRERLSL